MNLHDAGDTVAADAAAIGSERHAQTRPFVRDRAGAMLPRIAMAAAFAALLSAGAAHYFASRTEADRRALAQLIRDGLTPGPRTPPGVDPDPVGSIIRRAQATKLDPCGPDAKR